MNERIRELAEQAGFQSYITTHEEDVAMFEKFAELIVGECADISYKIAWDDLVRSEPESVIPLHIYNSIKEHFGVEE